MIAAKKKIRLKMKYPMELWAFSASDAGGPERDCDPDDSKQNPPDDGHGRILSAFVRNARACCRTGVSALNDVAAPGRFAHHPGITPGGVIRSGRDHSSMGPRRSRGRPVRAGKHADPHRGRRPPIIAPGVVQLGHQAPLP
jgi:hypothetical protein